ncbi:unnamed protein product, partial [marine sediment metagenome]
MEYCSQNVRVETSDGKTAYAKVDWGDGSSEYGDTPKTFVHRYEKGKTRTVTASATGYTLASKTFTTCISQFTLTLQKIIEKCNQSFKVTDTVGAVLSGATVTVRDRVTWAEIGSCTTDTYGKCTVNGL